ncbi:MAG: hypothetical protein IKQ92_13865 [Clostridia bacterium]|nr:hypothetical protein [Clostridia bacterium]
MKKRILTWAAVLLAVLLSLGVIAAAAGYDSSVDPIVTLSYLTTQFRSDMLAEIDNRFETLSAALQQAQTPAPVPEEPAPEPVEPAPPISEPASTAFEVVELTWGDTLYAAGACEVILRAGSAYCIAPDPTQGLADVTDGNEIYNGQALTKNHLCLIPRPDGRGLAAASESVFIMVRGEYTLGRLN